MQIQYRNGLIRNVPALRGRALIRAGAAKPVDRNYQTREMRATEPAATTVEVGETQVQKLRADYQDLYGKKPFMGWDESTLKQKIDEGLST